MRTSLSKKYLHPKNLFTCLIIFIIAINIVLLMRDTIRIIQIRKKIPFYFSGLQFSGLENVFHNVRYIGYYTDKDFSVKQNAAQFSEAQYILAPAILDLNNTDHELILFDCQNEQKAVEKMKEIRAVPIKKNNYGIILARRTK